MGTTNSQITLSANTTHGLRIRQRHGRAVNAIASFLRQSLRVPNVYLEPKISNRLRLDVMAVDAAGSGDVHAVEIKVPNAFVTSLLNLKVHVAQLQAMPAHFRYLALPKNDAIFRLLDHPLFYASDGIGRVGILLVTEHESSVVVEIAVQPERFRIDPKEMQKIERFIEKTPPDMFVRI